MATFLDQLAAEWYAYNGYFVRTNVPLRKRKTGGREGDADVIGMRRIGSKSQVIHIEASGAAGSLSAQLPVFTEKFRKAADDYESLTGAKPDSVKQVAIGGWAKNSKVSGTLKFEAYTVPQFIKMITDELKKSGVTSDTIPEAFPRLRAIQLVLRTVLINR